MSKIKVLMTGVDKKRVGGMWTVASNYINSEEYNSVVDLQYVATSTSGNLIKKTILMLSAFGKVRKILKRKQIDIVHIHMAEKGSVFRASRIVRIAKKHPAKVIIHMHAGAFIDWYNGLGNKKKNQIIEMFKYTDEILVLGEYWKKQLTTMLPAEKIKVLYNGVDIPKENAYNPGSKHIIYMGVLKREKGTYDLLDAINLIKGKMPEGYKVDIYGIDHNNEFTNYINKLGLDNVMIKGWVEGGKKEEALRGATVSVLPSYYEALSMTVLESMAYGVPIITTDISTMGEIIGNKKQLVKPGDIKALSQKILNIIENEKERVEISQNEYKQAGDKFSKQMNISTTLEFYKELLGITA